jgi:hypothetical protein
MSFYTQICLNIQQRWENLKYQYKHFFDSTSHLDQFYVRVYSYTSVNCATKILVGPNNGY